MLTTVLLFSYSSGPSQTYPQRAYRNPLDRLVTFLDAKHGENWSIWEFRAEGTGYPDEAVYGRIRHYPWPDHHPPPFRLVPMITASMRNWLHGEENEATNSDQQKDGKSSNHLLSKLKDKDSSKSRVVVVHCKAGKGRSGTMACSYLISQCGWTAEDALARFTERRMRPKFGAGVSIPSQLRWVSYVDRWTKGGKRYVEREVEIVEVHVWGLRHGVKVGVEGFADEGKKIKVFHTFTKKERHVVQGDAPGGGGMMSFIGDALSPAADDEEVYEDAEYKEIAGPDGKKGSNTDSSTSKQPLRNRSVKRLSANPKSKTINPADYMGNSNASSSSNLTGPNKASTNTSQPALGHSTTMADSAEPGGMAVIFKPATPIRIPNSDVCVSLERRNRAPASMGLTMVTAVAHVWFNTYFEGHGPERPDGRADESGVFDIEWEKMDGIKGSSRKGTKAADRISIVWRTVGAGAQSPGVVITEPGEGSPVPQMRPANWKGDDVEDPDKTRKLGLRTTEPGSAGVSKASSIKSQEISGSIAVEGRDSDDESLKGVKSAGPAGEEVVSDQAEHDKKVQATQGQTEDPDAASGATKSKSEILGESSGLRGGGDDEEAQGEHQTGDTTHLGFVKRGKKLLPMHSPENGKGSSAEDGSGVGQDGGRKDPKVLTAPVKE